MPLLRRQYTHHDVLEHAQVGLQRRRVGGFGGFLELGDDGSEPRGPLPLHPQRRAGLAQRVYLSVRGPTHTYANNHTHARTGTRVELIQEQNETKNNEQEINFQTRARARTSATNQEPSEALWGPTNLIVEALRRRVIGRLPRHSVVDYGLGCCGCCFGCLCGAHHVRPQGCRSGR